MTCFGICLLPLDIRQESPRHRQALSAITRYLGIGDFEQWDEEQKMRWLTEELQNKRPLLPRGEYKYSDLSEAFDEKVCDTLQTFDMIAEMPSEALGA